MTTRKIRQGFFAFFLFSIASPVVSSGYEIYDDEVLDTVQQTLRNQRYVESALDVIKVVGFAANLPLSTVLSYCASFFDYYTTSQTLHSLDESTHDNLSALQLNQFLLTACQGTESIFSLGYYFTGNSYFLMGTGGLMAVRHFLYTKIDT